MAAVAPFELPTRIRHLAVDERSIGLRATWRLELLERTAAQLKQ